MSDSTQQYILKQPIKAELHKSPSGLNDRYYIETKVGPIKIHAFDFEDLFELLDIPAIQKQLDEILQFDEDPHDKIYPIMRLFGLENTEREK